MVLLRDSHLSSQILSFQGMQKIWNISQWNGVCASRKTVMEIIHELDPEIVADRLKRRLRRRVYSVPAPDFFVTKMDTINWNR